MLSEEALIILAALGACGLLVLGVLELLWPTRPRRPVRRPPVVRPPQRHRTSALARHAREPGRSPYVRRTPAAAPLAPAAAEAVGPAEVALTGGALVEECFALHADGRHREAIERATAALAGAAEPEVPALWSVVAVAREALGDDEGAAAALEAASQAAGPGQRPAHQRRLATLAEGAARRLLAEADRQPGRNTEECLSAVRAAWHWIERGRAALPDDAGLAELATAARNILWSVWERTVTALVQRQDFRTARRLLREALADPGFPASRAERFRGLFSGTFSGELGQLTAQAIRSVQDAREADALAALQRAERLLGALSDEVLTPTRRQEVDRRLWWGYRTLGARRIAAGASEAALEPLFHALGYEVGSERHQETCTLLAQALAEVVDARAPAIRELADRGDREAAVVQCDKLWRLVRGASEMGLDEEDLAGTVRTVQHLFETLRP